MTLNIFFWQNTFSIHQASLFKELARRPGIKVNVLVNDIEVKKRIDEGWSLPDIPSINVSTANLYKKDFDNLDGVHVFSGLGAYRGFSSKIKKTAISGKSIFLMTEKPNLSGLYGYLKNIKYKCYSIYLSRHIKGVFSIGEDAVFWIKRLMPNRVPVFEFAYVGPDCTEALRSAERKVQEVVYVGRVEDSKGIIDYIALSRLFPKITFHIIGKCDSEKFFYLMENSANIKYHGVMDNDKLKVELSNFDLLVLPSRHDGWGFVVNEALSVGVPCLVSDNCGAKSVVRCSGFGAVFRANDQKDMVSKFRFLLHTNFLAKEIKLFFNINLSPEKMVDYFLECIYLEKPLQAPWRR